MFVLRSDVFYFSWFLFFKKGFFFFRNSDVCLSFPFSYLDMCDCWLVLLVCLAYDTQYISKSVLFVALSISAAVVVSPFSFVSLVRFLSLCLMKLSRDSILGGGGWKGVQ